jgi:hypothetical protein
MGAGIGELMCSQDRIGRSSLRRSCAFIIQANEYVLNITHFCKKVHTLPILHVYLLPVFLISLHNLIVAWCFLHINLRDIVEGADIHDVACQKRITCTDVTCRAVKVLLLP